MTKACPIVWHDVMTSDVEAAKQFYAAVLGWSYHVERPDYHVALAQEHAFGGILPAPDYLYHLPPLWCCYVETPSVDLACKRAEELGGMIFRPAWDIADTIRMGVIADPTGAPINIMQSLTGQGEAPPPRGTMGAVGWNELHAGDLDVAWDFYAGMFGWTKGQTVDMGAMGAYQYFQVNGWDTGAMMQRMNPMQRPMWQFYFRVESMSAAMLRITRNGGTVILGPQKIPTGNWVVSANDPQGGTFQLLSASL